MSYTLLKKYNIIKSLSVYTPILAGTIPININIEGSDLDIICQYQDKVDFTKDIYSLFSGFEGFNIYENPKLDAVVASFFTDGFTIEIFGQNIPTQQQNAYLHMVAEYKLLKIHGEAFRQKIIDLKKQGYKTEPAFAHVLGLTGNPYEALLNILV